MVDLKGQYEKIKSEVDNAISDVLNNTNFINGPQVKELEKKLVEYLEFSGDCISCANGTDALQIAMMALGLKPGDEIIVPSFTYIATVEAAALLGIRPVFVDSHPDTFNINIEKIKNKISFRSRAIVPVHLYGQCADMEAVTKLAKDNDLYIIEDVAQALGAEYIFKDKKKKKAGTIGDISITSFFPSKNLGCYGDGGAIFTKDPLLAEKIKMIANHGQKEKYYHDIIGLNSRLDTIQAAILQIKLKELEKFTKARQQAAAYYDKKLANHSYIQIPYRDSHSTHVFHQYTIKLSGVDRNKFKKYLEEKSIPTMIYYPVPVHLQKGYSYLGYKEGDFPIAEDLCKNVISLPIHTELDEEQLSYITEHILNFFNK
ncbi:MAG: DegT/DnrJ/EryC1/StrS family aminotransferase [Cytophagaceae bacterium]